MADTAAVIQHNWRRILLFTVLSAAVATITVFIMPKQYRSTARLVAANPQLADKSRLFNENIQGLYSYFGSGDDLDRIMGIADLDTTYKQLVDEYQLIAHFALDNDSLPQLRRKAVLKLRKDLSFQRTEEGQLKISCWTKDRQLSASLINTLVAIVEKKLESIWQYNYQASVTKLNASVAAAEEQYRQLSDSLQTLSAPKAILVQKHMETILEQLAQYRKTADAFKLMDETAPKALYVLEEAVPAAKAERPDKPAIIIAAAIAGFIFSILLLLVGNHKRSL